MYISNIEQIKKKHFNYSFSLQIWQGIENVVKSTNEWIENDFTKNHFSQLYENPALIEKKFQLQTSLQFEAKDNLYTEHYGNVSRTKLLLYIVR